MWACVINVFQAKCIHMQADSLKEWKRIHDIDNANAVSTDENVLTNKRFHAIPRHMYIAEGRPVSSGSAMSTPSKIQWAERSLHGMLALPLSLSRCYTYVSVMHIFCT